MSWTISAKWHNHDRTAFHWKILAMCFDTESLGVVARSLRHSGQDIRILNSESNAGIAVCPKCGGGCGTDGRWCPVCQGSGTVTPTQESDYLAAQLGL